MKRFEKHSILTVLKNTIDELIVVSRGKYNPTLLVGKKPPEKRFQEKIHESVYKKLDPFQLPAETLNEIKLLKEMNHAITVFSKIYEEIAINGTFEFLRTAIDEQKQVDVDEQNLINEYNKSSEHLTNIKKKFSKKVTAAEIRLHITNEIIDKFKNDLDSIQQVNEVEMSLVQRWEQTRFDQAEILRKRDEKKITEEIRILEMKKEKEKRNIIDIENSINIVVEDYKKKILYWQDRYQTEMEELLAEIKKTSKNILQIKKKHEKFFDTYTERQDLIDEYREGKAEEQRQLELQQKRVECSIRLQAWWRGVMVRKCLGPFKKKKKGKKGRKGK